MGRFPSRAASHRIAPPVAPPPSDLRRRHPQFPVSMVGTDHTRLTRCDSTAEYSEYGDAQRGADAGSPHVRPEQN